MKKQQDNVEFAVFGDAVPAAGTARRKSAPTHMNAETRMAFYLAAAGLIEGGFSAEDAGKLIANEYQADGRRMESHSAQTFFEGLATSKSTAEMGEVAVRAFGRNFVGPEEMILLRALPSATSLAPVLRAAASLVALRFRVTDERPAAARG